MVKIVTGKINSGKSTMIYEMYQKDQLGDGFISVKRMHYDKVHGYDIMRLKDLSMNLFVIREENLTDSINISCQIGPYIFIKESLSFIETEITKMIDDNISPIYLDEIGQLELYDQGFHNIFKKILSSKSDCVITVREDLVEKVIEKYNIKESNIIRV